MIELVLLQDFSEVFFSKDYICLTKEEYSHPRSRTLVLQM
jgi:hypothetical protein